jgi:hypothetical protein
MARVISVSDEAYEWILKKSSEYSIERNENVSMAGIIDEVIEIYEKLIVKYQKEIKKNEQKNIHQ